jgi:hypothetical protein
MAYHCYADDTQIYQVIKLLHNWDDISDRLEACLFDIKSWICTNMLKLNQEWNAMLQNHIVLVNRSNGNTLWPIRQVQANPRQRWTRYTKRILKTIEKNVVIDDVKRCWEIRSAQKLPPGVKFAIYIQSCRESCRHKNWISYYVELFTRRYAVSLSHRSFNWNSTAWNAMFQIHIVRVNRSNGNTLWPIHQVRANPRQHWTRYIKRILKTIEKNVVTWYGIPLLCRRYSNLPSHQTIR